MDWESRRPELFRIVDGLSLFPPVLVNIIVDFLKPNRWCAYKTFNLPNEAQPFQLAFDGHYLWITDFKNYSVHQCDLDGKLVRTVGDIKKRNRPFTQPRAIDYSHSEKQVFVGDDTKLQSLTLNKRPGKVMGAFIEEIKLNCLWEKKSFYGLDIVIDKGKVFTVNVWQNQVFVYEWKTGKLLQTFGPNLGEYGGSGDGQFKSPHALALHPTLPLLYIVDSGNNRIQILDKETGAFHSKWGKDGKEDGLLHWPLAICLYDDSPLRIFVGDTNGVQLFQEGGLFVQRVIDARQEYIKTGGNAGWYGMKVIHDRLYLCDRHHQKIVIYGLE